MENRILSRSRIWSQSQSTPPTDGQAETTTETVPAPNPEPANEGMPKNGRINVKIRRGRLI